MNDGNRNGNNKITFDCVRSFQLLENCFNPLTLSAEGGSGGAAPKIGDVMYDDKTWGSADDYDGSKTAVGIVAAVGNDGSVKIVNLRDLTFSSRDTEGNFDPDDPYGGSMNYSQWTTDDKWSENITAIPDFTAGQLTITGSGGDSSLGVDSSQQDRFNSIINQYDMLISDASYKGVNMLKGDTLTVNFNEDRSSTYVLNGRDISAANLGINIADWQTADDVQAALDSIRSAILDLRNYSAELGNGYSIIQNRQNFTDNLISILTEGADKLTLADMNEESANMLALQTRQQLAINALSLASQANQAVLKLF